MKTKKEQKEKENEKKSLPSTPRPFATSVPVIPKFKGICPNC